jgi:hypothetical protein
LTIEGPSFGGPEMRRRGRRTSVRRLVVSALVLGAVFALGIALGQALHDNPKPVGTRTYVGTLQPSTLLPTRATATAQRAP